MWAVKAALALEVPERVVLVVVQQRGLAMVLGAPLQLSVDAAGMAQKVGAASVVAALGSLLWRARLRFD